MPENITGVKKKPVPELLAPAGSPEAFLAAVAAGADAVYLSGKRFGARQYAPNFTETEIESALGFAHARGVCVYVTVNTLIHDRELTGVAEYLIWLYSAGVDAVLVQDIGVAALAREILPDLAIHASTQMTVHNTEGVRWAADQGFSRVVLSRELSLEEVRHIAAETRSDAIGLEVFGHGALCYSYSGQCLLSSAIGGRSGNRGMCAQPCRKPYALVSGETDAYGKPVRLHEIPQSEHYLLSPKDLCTYRSLAELAEADIASLKIEGRMKSPEYVAVVVSTYRRALDAVAAGTFRPSPEAERDLLLAFNRGFTGGYLFGARHGSFMGRDAPDNRGLHIGSVLRWDEKTHLVSVRLKTSVVPQPGDGLFFSLPKRPDANTGFFLNNVPQVREKNVITFAAPRPVKAGSFVFITSSRDLEARARQLIARSSARPGRPVPVDLTVVVDSRGNLVMDGTILPGNKHQVHLVYAPDILLAPARSRPLTRDQLDVQMRKTGGTPFYIRDCILTYSGDRFAPPADLNRARREFFRQAQERMIETYRPSQERVGQARQRWHEKASRYAPPCPCSSNTPSSSELLLTVYTDTLEGVRQAAEAGCSAVCFEPDVVTPACGCREPDSDQSTVSRLLLANAVCRDKGVRFIWKFPKITRDAYLQAVLPVLRIVREQGISECMVDNTGTARALLSTAPSLGVSGSAGLSVFNHKTACHLSSLFRSVTLSMELSGEEIHALIHAARSRGCLATFALIVQGTSETMVSDDCLLQPYRHCNGKISTGKTGEFFGIRDATAHVFPVRIDGNCRTHIGNAAEICLVDHLPAILQAGIGEVAIDARGRTGAYAGEMTRIYREAISRMKTGSNRKVSVHEPLKDSIKRLAVGGITTGHFKSGLKEPCSPEP